MSVILMAIAMQLVPAADEGAARGPVLKIRSPRQGCGVAADSEVVICGDRDSRYRLPLPRERDADVVSHAAGEAPAAVAAITPAGRCGLFAGERRCGKAEAARYGYGEGRDPITLLSKLGRALVSPDDAP